MTPRQFDRRVLLGCAVVAVIYLLIGGAGMARAHSGVWHSDTAASAHVTADVQPFARVTCHGYGARRAHTQKHRRFACLGFDSDVVCTFTVRFTTRGLRYEAVDCA